MKKTITHKSDKLTDKPAKRWRWFIGLYIASLLIIAVTSGILQWLVSLLST